jgi:Na+/citrate or Na+/malate symporter
MKLDYESLKTKLSEESVDLYELFVNKIICGKALGIETKTLINKFNNYFFLVREYI